MHELFCEKQILDIEFTPRRLLKNPMTVFANKDQSSTDVQLNS